MFQMVVLFEELNRFYFIHILQLTFSQYNYLPIYIITLFHKMYVLRFTSFCSFLNNNHIEV